MRKITTILILLACSSFALADDEYKRNFFTFAVKTGFAIHQNETINEVLSSNTTLGLNLYYGAEVTFWTRSGFGLGGQVQFYPNDDKGVIDKTAYELDLTVIPININAYYNFSQGTRLSYAGMVPYVYGGVTIAKVDLAGLAVEENEEVPSKDNVKFDDFVQGFNFGVGIQGLNFADNAFVEFQYIFIRAKDDNPPPNNMNNMMNAQSDPVVEEVLLRELDGSDRVNLGGFVIWIGWRF